MRDVTEHPLRSTTTDPQGTLKSCTDSVMPTSDLIMEQTIFLGPYISRVVPEAVAQSTGVSPTTNSTRLPRNFSRYLPSLPTNPFPLQLLLTSLLQCHLEELFGLDMSEGSLKSPPAIPWKDLLTLFGASTANAPLPSTPFLFT